MTKINCLLLIFCLLQSSLIWADEYNADILKQQEECRKNSSMEWNTKLNRCVLTQKNLDNRNDAKNCNEIKDIKARENCHIKLAENKTALSSDPKSLNQGQTSQSLMINGLAAAYYVVGMINAKAKGGSESKCTSKNILGITALAGLGSDVFLKMKAKKKVKSLEDKYKLDVETGAHEAQVSALEYLKEEQQTVVEISSLEKKRNMALVAGYGLAAGFAAYELSPWGQNPGCYESESTKQEKAQKAQDNKAADQTHAQKSPEANPQSTPDETPKAVTAQDKALADGLNIDTLLQSPIGVITVAGLGTVFSMKLYSGASEQEKESKENIKKIDKILANFKDSFANQCTGGRDNLAEPKCYCYKADGTKNTARTNSQTCTQLWAKDDFKLNGDAANYALGALNTNPTGCVTVDGQFDEDCRCKKYINSNGQNACKKETTINLPSELSGGFANSAGLNDLLAFSSKANGGSPGLDSLSEAKLNQNAINSKKFAEQMLTKIAPENGTPQVVDEKNALKVASALLGSRNLANAGQYGSALPMNVAHSRSDNPKVENLLKAAQEKAGVDIMASSGKGLNNKNASGAKKLKFDFVSEGSSENKVIAGFPEEKNYNYKNSDIVTDNSASIFEIISNRYINSGLRRLFEE